MFQLHVTYMGTGHSVFDPMINYDVRTHNHCARVATYISIFLGNE